jgi:hypothetical protein
MPISDKRKWKVNMSPDEILKIVTNKLKQRKAKLIVATSKMIVATIGSGLKTRFLADCRFQKVHFL